MPRNHPYFQSTPIWHHDLAEALGADNPVLAVVSRITCAGSRALVEKTMSKDEVAEYLEQHFVCCAVEADALPETLAPLVRDKLPADARTPFCVYLDPSGRFLHATAGGRPAAVFL